MVILHTLYSVGHKLVDAFIIVIELVQNITTLATGRTNQSANIYNTKSTGKIHVYEQLKLTTGNYLQLHLQYNMKIFH